LLRSILIGNRIVEPDSKSANLGSSVVSLGSLHKGARGVVASVREDGAEVGDTTGATVVMRLIEIGFVPGEAFEIVAESRPGGDPIAVRIGGSCFALRRREANAVLVQTAPAGIP
jgi:ferrous iron transport protein A